MGTVNKIELLPTFASGTTTLTEESCSLLILRSLVGQKPLTLARNPFSDILQKIAPLSVQPRVFGKLRGARQKRDLKAIE